MTRHISTLLVIVCSFATSSLALCQTDTTATVAAWNIEDGDGRLTRVGNIAAGISWLDPEVVVLTECHDREVMQDLIDELDDIGAAYTAFVPDQTARDHIAILAKDDVVVTNVQLLADSDTGNPSLRKAVTANVTVGDFDFILVGVHLKAGRPKSSREIRTNQCTVISSFVEQATAGSEKDVMVIGDLNMIPPSSSSAKDRDNFDAMNPDGSLRFVSSEDLLGQGSHIKKNGDIGNLLDGFAINSEGSDEYIDGSLRIFPLHRTFRVSLKDFGEEVSDHLPLIARFVITDDDD